MQTYTQENPPEYGRNASYKEKPNTDNMRNGVVPLDTLPAQWWNWLWNNVTTILIGVNDEVHDIYEELKSVLASQGLSPDDNTLNQLYIAIDKIHTTIATAAKPGSVLSSSDEGKVSVDAATGVMTANGLGKISDLTTEVKTSVVQAINWLMSYSASLAYPVGSLYWSSKPTDPGTLFPGTTWTQIKDKFVYAAGSKNVNATGGAETVTLKVENLPSHNHTFTGTAVTPTGSFSGTSSVDTSESGKWSFGMRMGIYGSGNVIVPVWGETHSGPDTENVPAGFSSYVYNTDAKLIGGSQRHSTFDIDSVHTASPVFISHPGHTHTVTPSGSISINEITPAGSITIGSITPNGSISNTGSGQAVDKMPPYVVKYCWERTA